MKYPDFFLVGASKAGTTTITDALANHPDICFSEVKEPNFFSEFDIDLEEIPRDELIQYTKLFKIQNYGQRIGEGSVKYLDSRNASYWISKYIPSAKILIFLRNPIERVVSLYEMYTRLGIIQMNSDEAFAPSSYVVKQCLLYEKILAYINNFPREHILIMVFDDFLMDKDRSFQDICQFIEVQKIPDMCLETRNKGGVPKSKLFDFMCNRNLIEIAKKILPSSVKFKTDYFIKSTFFKKVDLKPDQIKSLKQVFYEDVKKIGDLMDRNLCDEWQIFDDPS